MPVPGRYDFDVSFAGDTVQSQEFRLSEGGNPIDLTDADVFMDITRGSPKVLITRFSNGTAGGITITDAPNGHFVVGGGFNPLADGNFSYTIKVEFPNGVVTTYLMGVYPILNNR